MTVNASLRFLRMSPRKVRLVIDAIRGLGVREAETRLSFMKQHAAEPVLKLLRSAMANAQHNFQTDPSTLMIKTITADGGPTIKRFRPRAMGRAAPIRKRTTHIMLILATRGEKANPPAGGQKLQNSKQVSKTKKQTTKSASKANSSQLKAES